MKKLLLAIALLILATGAVLYLSPAAQLTAYQSIEQWRAGLHERSVSVNDLPVSYYEGGPPGADTVLLVHGFGADKSTWLWFARDLTERYHVIAVDLPGFGASGRPHGSYDVGTQTERLAAFTEALSIRRMHVVGHSMGGHIAALYAARYPQQITSLALMANAGVSAPQRSAFFQRMDEHGDNPLLIERTPQFDQLLDWLFVAPPQLPEHIHNYLAQRAVDDSAHQREVFEHLQQRYLPLEPELPRISAPTLLLWGDQDRILDVSSVEAMKPLLVDVSVVIIKGCGHAPMLERPEETAAHYRHFLDGIGPGKTTEAGQTAAVD
ncbi:alpha/beta fold hydrolase [Phytopseudomonas seleniipraecipitans]|uniref:Pimeloyl-ACP methyl ester carboxylesterase n=1 Tax=Phytopseudomonas seleniipraecipitans TaxID=640205 RepID=A0A1G7SZD0_9GAMM|nr:alpha/beta fold hydrolase [Pseudomonas seleniipraecipitans]SDG28456.1 Pimeloyl-ACP methyl ester carboxylesterase [Pseudomonas seleniipraecipitans]